jgi:hypothetical protein
MPIYQFRHPEYPIVIEEVQKMSDPHVYIDGEGVEWVRVWSVPNASVDSNPDPFDSKAFVDSTRDTKGTYGDMMDRAKEASEKRIQKLGYDPVKQEYYKNYSKERNGMKHFNQKTEDGTP